ncbi:MAG: class I SAM-dependent methyltransferase [Gemmataceae bacterium]
MFHPNGPTFFELTEQALSSTQHGYDLLAPKFDRTPFRTPQSILDAVTDYLRPLAPFGAALDLCCGTGAGMAALRPLCRERVVGIDFSRGMLEVCRRNLVATPGEADLAFVRGDARDLPFGPEFDLVTCFGALGHIARRDERRFVAEAARVLRPGGRFVVVTTYRPPWWTPRAWLAELFNVAMSMRNGLVAPPFVMYYLTFLLPGVRRLLEEQGLAVEEYPLALRGAPPEWRLVVATRRAISLT